MSGLDLGSVADQFVAQYNELLSQCSSWLKVKEDYKKFLKDRDLLLLGMSVTMLKHTDRLKGNQEFLMTTTNEDEVAQFTVIDDFGVTGLSLFIDVDWDTLFNDPVAWAQMQQFYDIFLLGLAIAAQWGAPDVEESVLETGVVAAAI